ncbi:MAG TPA: hypothetical protein VFA60_04435 [Terriglobales bacterium]|nr:hypothetical protein [Terriglobales bacterium]
MRRARVLLLLLAGCAASADAQTNAIDPDLAAGYIRDLQATSDADAGRLWGVPLCGPFFFVDPETHAVVANQADAEGKLKPQGSVFTGTLPPEVSPANTAINWAGVHWTMVMWPVSQFRQPRRRLLAHECFHRIQDSIGLPGRDAINSHLDSMAGRTWLQLEWRALERALRQRGKDRRVAAADALLFRAYRRSLFPDAAERENALEMNEGLAEYTGVKISASTPEEFAVLADFAVRQGTANATFVRSFAYASGPAYGALLDLSGKPWRPRAKEVKDLGQLLAAAYSIRVPSPVTKMQAEARAAEYNADEVFAAEQRRDRVRQQRVADARKKLIDGPVLVLPVGNSFNYSYDPNTVVAIDSNNTVYPRCRLTDEWGILDVSGSALLIRDAAGKVQRAHVPAPASAADSKGDGWTLTLNPGWRLVAGERAGDLTISKQ